MAALGEREVMTLLANDPFPQQPPQWVRVVAYRYRFTRWGDGVDGWWTRERVQVLVGPLTVDDPALVEHLRRRGWVRDPT